ncbi:MAG: Soluble epoxide hydrolase [Dehalococcoidia bacterium]|nr:Soluble epoxide hydrolase [Dehalococcoidia bacterium]
MPIESINGFRMYYEVHGNGYPFVWIHGGLGGGEGSDGFTKNHAQALSDPFRLIFYDRRTAGRSESPSGGYSMAVFAEDVHALLNRLSVDRAHVLGSSAGGPIAMTFALEHPEMVNSLFLINTMTYSSEPERVARRKELDSALEVERSKGREAAAESAVLYRQPQLKSQDPERFQRLLKIRLEQYEGIHRTLEAYLAVGDSIEKRLGELKMPVFIAHGDADATIPVRCGQDLHQGIPGSDLHIIPGAGHGLTANEPELMRKLMLDFLGRVAQPVA